MESGYVYICAPSEGPPCKFPGDLIKMDFVAQEDWVGLRLCISNLFVPVDAAREEKRERSERELEMQPQWSYMECLTYYALKVFFQR